MFAFYLRGDVHITYDVCTEWEVVEKLANFAGKIVHKMERKVEVPKIPKIIQTSYVYMPPYSLTATFPTARKDELFF